MHRRAQIQSQCLEHGISSEFKIPPQPELGPSLPEKQAMPIKWCIYQDFRGINKVTKVAPVPQGNIHAKQLQLSGHQYIHVFNFAAGFYGIRVHPDSQPYITFFMEGRGYFAYQCMLFGVTGGPSEFGHVTGEHFHNLMAKAILRLFVDDGGMASDSFEVEEGIDKL